MLMVIDVGNSNSVLGIYNHSELTAHWRLETKKERTADEFGVFVRELLDFHKIAANQISAIVIASVVPTLNHTLMDMCERYFHITPLMIGPDTKSPLTLKIDQPQEIGADRIVNGVAAHKKYKLDCLIIDFGTATTFDYVTSQGEYHGGVICPGINISAEALFHRTSKLPRVEIARPKTVVGKNTITCIQSGLYYGYIGLIDSMVQRIESEVGKKLEIIATGGLANLIAKDSKTIGVVDENLTLTGLKILYDYQN